MEGGRGGGGHARRVGARGAVEAPLGTGALGARGPGAAGSSGGGRGGGGKGGAGERGGAGAENAGASSTGRLGRLGLSTQACLGLGQLLDGAIHSLTLGQ